MYTVIQRHKQYLVRVFAVYRAFDKQKCKLVSSLSLLTLICFDRNQLLFLAEELFIIYFIFFSVLNWGNFGVGRARAMLGFVKRTVAQSPVQGLA